MNPKSIVTVTAVLLLWSGLPAASRAHAQVETVELAQPPDRSWVGFSASSRNLGPMVITGVAEGSPAAAAGFEIGDSIVAVNGLDALAIPRPNFRLLDPGVEYRVRVRRGSAEIDLVLVPATLPAEPSRC